jgi:hypothetical protein
MLAADSPSLLAAHARALHESADGRKVELLVVLLVQPFPDPLMHLPSHRKPFQIIR